MMAEEKYEVPTPQEETAGAAPEEEKETEAPAPEEEETGSPEETSPETEKLRSEYAELNDRYLRLAAEYENYRRRTAREREGVWQDATAKAVTAFLSVADNFERALEAPCGDPEFRKGMDLIFRSLHDALTSLGAEPFGEEGEPFDPALHNAVMHVEDEELGAQVVAGVLQKGYRMGDRVLRHAMVRVAN